MGISYHIYLKFSDIILSDPSWKEEQIMQGRITITSNIHKEICAVQKSGGVSLTVDQILAFLCFYMF